LGSCARPLSKAQLKALIEPIDGRRAVQAVVGAIRLVDGSIQAEYATGETFRVFVKINIPDFIMWAERRKPSHAQTRLR
jgi:hypothetical protein